MGIGRNGAVARQLATLFNVGVTGTLTDGQLLERFANRRGKAAELAFAVLVERHGPLVLRVCRSSRRAGITTSRPAGPPTASGLPW
ncbi:hypothetical protein P12x_002886 [Tundrisphaera lichenicola]|uniref:hypothetical protein n=1 Tax=Tundrisphaera lichenicola TaxID=2029860 RepID=UPI003EB9B789